MPLRFLNYSNLLYQRRYRDHKTWRKGDTAEPVLHVVVYNGDRRWDAPLTLAGLLAGRPHGRPAPLAVRYEVVDLVAARLEAVPRANLLRRVAEVEQSVQAGTLPQRVRELGEWLADEGEPGLTRTFDLWLGALAEKWGMALPSIREYEEVHAVLLESWTAPPPPTSWPAWKAPARSGRLYEHQPQPQPRVRRRLVLQQHVQPRRCAAGRALDRVQQVRLAVAQAVVDEAGRLPLQARPAQLAADRLRQVCLQQAGRLGDRRSCARPSTRQHAPHLVRVHCQRRGDRLGILPQAMQAADRLREQQAPAFRPRHLDRVARRA